MRQIFLLFTAIVLSTCTVDKKDRRAVEHQDTTTVYSETTLKLKSNTIPPDVFKMTRLLKLSVIGMDCDYTDVDDNGNDVTKCWTIREIPEEIKELKQLEALVLRVNSIQNLPEAINSLENLRVLDLTDNPGLSNIDPIVGVENLEELVLFGCSLTKLPEGIGKLKKLKYLGLTGNNLDKTEQNRILKALPTCEIVF
jgi:Leucine-rich repeat (LRR) protein